MKRGIAEAIAKTPELDPLDSRPTLMIVAGEVSSDQLASSLAAELFARIAGVSIFGMGGTNLRRIGVETIVDSETHASVMGFTELRGSMSKVYRAFQTLVSEAERRRPDLAILLDFPDFNLRLARRLHRLGIRTVYFVSPQLWAWRKRRVNFIRRYIERVITIFPFEEHFYERHGVAAEYVGHPFVDRPPVTLSRSEFCLEHGLDPTLPIIALLPGSRRGEVERLLPPLVSAFSRIREGRPGIQAVIPVAPSLDTEWVSEQVRNNNAPGVTIVAGYAREALASADVAVVASGTATVEAALSGIPFVVVYRLSAISYLIARTLVTGVKYFAMPNLVAGESIVPELLQDEVTPERIANEVETLLGSPIEASRMRRRLAVVSEKLSKAGSPGETAISRTASIIISILRPGAKSAGRLRWR